MDARRSGWALAACAIVLTLSHWALLHFRIPVLAALRGWFWPFQSKPIALPWFFGLLVLMAGALWVIRRQRVWLQVSALVVLGSLLQLGLGFSEGRGVQGIRDRMTTTGHAEFALYAVKERNVLDVMRNYEKYVQAGRLGTYARSKPPGQLLLYMATQRLADRINPRSSLQEKHEWMGTFASYLWPVLSYLVVIPMVFFGRRYLGSDAGMLAGGLYLLVPSVALITLHTDQTFFPFLAMGAVLIAALASEKQSFALGVTAGAWVYLSVFCSFGLLFVLPLLAGVVIASGTPRRPADYKTVPIVGGGLLVGAIAIDLLLRWTLDYDILTRHQNATAHHFAWKGRVDSPSDILSFAFLNALEYVVWLGLPIATLACASLLASFPRLARGRLEMPDVLPSALLVAFSSLMIFSGTKGEVARLWLFMAPFFCLVAGQVLADSSRDRPPWLVPLVFVLQAGTVLLIKANQDFS